MWLPIPQAGFLIDRLRLKKFITRTKPSPVTVCTATW